MAEDDKLATTVHNERTKLLANAFDRASTACFTVGVAVPAAGYIYGRVPDFGVLIAAFIVWLAAVYALHRFARRVLGTLK